MPFSVVIQHGFPDHVAVAFDDDVGAAPFVRLLGKERGVNAAEDDERAGRTGRAADGISAQRIAGVNADADDIAGPDGRRVERLERFVGDLRRAESFRRRVRKHVEPPRRHEADAERMVAGIDEMNGQVARHYTTLAVAVSAFLLVIRLPEQPWDPPLGGLL